MLEQLLPYYERELTYLRELSREFAQRYPKIARRLLLEGDQSEDPHVERIIEAFAFLAARVHRKLDDEFPEITEGFMQVLYPHYTQPFPSCTILRMETNAEKPEIAARHRVARHETVLSPPIDSVACRFRTCYDVDLWPLNLSSVRLETASGSEQVRRLAPDAAAAITLELETQADLSIAQIKLDRLRFFLDGDPALMHLLYELLLTKVARIRVSDGTDNPAHTTILPGGKLTPVGFAPDHSLIDYDERSFVGYRLLTEYFAFPDKFLFIDLNGLDAPPLQHSGRRLCIQIFLTHYADSERYNRLLQTLSATNLKLGCTPAINLFAQAAEPIRLTHQRTTYPVCADHHRMRAFEVVAIQSVTYVRSSEGQGATREIPPFYSIRHHASGEDGYFWYAARERSVREHDKGTDVEIAFVDMDFTPRRPEAEVLSMELVCSNRDLPEHLPFGGSVGGPHTDFALPSQSIVKRVRLLRKPTAAIRAPAKRGLQWRLVSHLSLNHLSIVAQGKEAFQEMLALYNHGDSPSVSRQIRGIRAIDSKAATARVGGPHFSGFVRGVDIGLTLDESAFVGGGVYLFASVLERFFALYCSPNSFTRLRLSVRQQDYEQEVAQWPARAGEALVI